MSGSRPARLELVADTDQLQQIARRIAASISADHPDGVTVIGVLKDSVVFLADVLRHVTVPVDLDFVAVAPYDGLSGRTHLLKDLDRPVEGRDVVLVAGLVDTGLSLDYLRRHLLGFAPRTLRICALADKASRRLVPVALDYLGLEVGDRHHVGYGLDHRELHRNVRGIWCADPGTAGDVGASAFAGLAPR